MSAVPSIQRPAVPTFTIQGQEVRLPVRVRDASSAAATFVVSAAAARRLIPASDVIELAEIFPGRALCSLAAIEYRDNDLGRYNEISFAFFVRPKGTSRGIPYVNTLSPLQHHVAPGHRAYDVTDGEHGGVPGHVRLVFHG